MGGKELGASQRLGRFSKERERLREEGKREREAGRQEIFWVFRQKAVKGWRATKI